jgi:hypothetical protein
MEVSLCNPRPHARLAGSSCTAGRIGAADAAILDQSEGVLACPGRRPVSSAARRTATRSEALRAWAVSAVPGVAATLFTVYILWFTVDIRPGLQSAVGIHVTTDRGKDVMSRGYRAICLGVATLMLSGLSVTSVPAHADPFEVKPQFPGNFTGCGQAGSRAIATTACIIVLNRTRGWVGPGEPTFSGGYRLSGSAISGAVHGGSRSWIATNTRDAEGTFPAPLIDPLVPVNGSPGIWAGARCRTAFSTCTIRSEWRIGAATPNVLESLIRLRGGDTALLAELRTRASGTTNTEEVRGNPWVSLTSTRARNSTSNGRVDAVARNYTVRVTVVNRVRDQALLSGDINPTGTAIEDRRARSPQNQNGYGFSNGSDLLAPMVRRDPLSAGVGEYGFVTRVSGQVQFVLPFTWIGSPGIDANGNTATVSIDLEAGAARHDDDRSTCRVTGSFGPSCSITVSTSDNDGARVRVEFYER